MYKVLKKIYSRINFIINRLIFYKRSNTILFKLFTDKPSIKTLHVSKFNNLKGRIELQNSTLVVGNNVGLSKNSSIDLGNSAYVKINDNVKIGPSSTITADGSNILIGSETTFFSDCILSGEITIGKSCLFAKNISIFSSTHNIDGKISIRQNDLDSLLKNGGIVHQKVVIGDHCWLGNNVVVLPGVKLGEGVVVGANSVVTKSFPSCTVVGGTPAKIIKGRLITEEPTTGLD